MYYHNCMVPCMLTVRPGRAPSSHSVGVQRYMGEGSTALRLDCCSLYNGLTCIICVTTKTEHRDPACDAMAMQWLPTHFLSKAVGATATTTTKLATISAKVTSETKTMLPRDAGNFPRMRKCWLSKYLWKPRRRIRIAGENMISACREPLDALRVDWV